jgi:hypothetical protein
MKLYAEMILKRNIEFILFITLSLLCLLLIGTNLKLILTERKPTLIAIDQNGTRIVKDFTDPIFNSEATHFLQRFLSNTYNFNRDNFMQRIGLSTSLMSDELWKSKKNSVLSLKDKIERDEISLSGTLEKITKDDTGVYHALLKVEEHSRLQTTERKIEVSIKLSTSVRSENNPWGLEVAEYEETLLRE